MTYAEQLYVIKNIPISEGQRRIITCPFCYVSKKLSLSKIDGTIMWNCFRASCAAKGIHSSGRTIEYAKNYINNIKTTISKGRPLPEITTAIENNLPALEYLESVNCLEAYQRKLIKIRYCPADNRVVFYYKDGAVGRLLHKGTPKWVTYGELNYVLVGSGSSVVMVEDIPSACSVSRLPDYAGLAILGTKLSHDILKTVRQYNNRYLVLDNDAALRSIIEASKFGNNIKVRLTKRDLKLLNICEIQTLLQLQRGD